MTKTKRWLFGGVAALVFLTAGYALAQNVLNYTEQGGARTVIGGSLDVASGGDLDVESGGALKLAGATISSSAAELDDVTIQVIIANISTASTSYTVSHFAGDVTDWYCILAGAITPGDAVLTLQINGTAPTTGSSLTVAAASTEGAIDSDSTVAGNNTLTAGQSVSVITDGGSTTARQEVCTIVIDR